MNIPRNALKAVSLAMANRDVRKHLNGMLIECSGRTVRLVATDGHRLHITDLPQDVPCPPPVEGVIIPRALIDERYPDYARILPRGIPTGEVSQFQPQYVSDAYAAVKELARKGEPLFPTLLHNGAYGAATVAYERFLAVIMPLRVTMGYEPDARLFAPVADPIEE